MTNLLLRTVGWFAALPYLFVLFLVLTGPATWSGILYVLAMGAMVIGLTTMPLEGRPRRRPRGLTRGGLAAIGVVAFLRCFTAGSGTSLAISDGDGGSSRLVDRVVDEADVAVAGTRVLTASGLLTDDARVLPSAMRAAYDDMRKEQGDAPSPVLATYLGLQRPGAFDLLLVEPPSGVPARDDAAVVFLHGYAGNFALPCWQMARAVAPLGVVTACPSTRWVGDWWSPEGEATLRRTVDVLRARGKQTIVLAGLSNGGYGASRLAPRMKGAFAGVIVISGAAPDAGAPGVPTLAIHGAHDAMAGIEEARAYAAKTSGRLVVLDAGHFAMLVRAEESDRAVREFVEARLSARSRRAAGSSASR